MLTYLDQLLDIFSEFWTALQQGNVLPLGNWNYFILFVLVIIQGPLVKLLSGAMVSTTYLNLFGVMLVSILASLSADTWWYFVGRKGKFEHYFRRKSEQRKKVVMALQVAMQKHYFKVLLLGKLGLGLALPSVLTAGFSQIPWRKWFPAVLLGELIYSSALVLTGFYASESLNQSNQTIRIVGIAFTAIFILVLIFYLPYTIRKSITNDPKILDRSIEQ